MSDTPFKFFAPVQMFEKADEPEGKRRRIAGIVTSENKDREGEVILQRGLDFSEFMDFGFWNENHSKDADGVLGEPEHVNMYQRGERLPDGSKAPAACHWAEGFLYQGDPRADKMWQKGLAMQKSGGKRRLGFSIEGVIQKRMGADNKTIAKAKVRHVALTHVPVNTDTYLHALEKAITDAECEKSAEQLEEEKFKALMSTSTSGRALMPESLEHDKPKCLNKSQAVAWMKNRFPNISTASAEKLVQTTFAFSASGLI